MTLPLIDVHHHARPAGYTEALASVGIRSVGGRPVMDWEYGPALELMDTNSIQTAILSSPDVESAFSHKTLAVRLSRDINEMYAGLIAKDGSRFGGFASLPLPHVDEALAELSYALDTLKLDGVFFSSNHAGIYPGDSRFDPVLAELDRRKAVVFVHPASPPMGRPNELGLPGWLVEFPSDTTRCIANLIAADVPGRFPGIRFIFSHAGGFAPFFPFRLAAYGVMRDDAKSPVDYEQALGHIQRCLRSFYFDTALSAHPATLSILQEMVGGDRILFGSDHPQVPLPLIKVCSDTVLHVSKSQPALSGVAHVNALALLPRLRSTF